MKEHLPGESGLCNPTDELWLAVGALETVAHGRKGIAAHSPHEVISVSFRTDAGQDMRYTLVYEERDGLYWPALGLSTVFAGSTEIFGTFPGDRIRHHPPSHGRELEGNDAIHAMADQVHNMYKLIERKPRHSYWAVRTEGR